MSGLTQEEKQEIVRDLADHIRSPGFPGHTHEHYLKGSNAVGELMKVIGPLLAIVSVFFAVAMAWATLNAKVDTVVERTDQLTAQTRSLQEDFRNFNVSGDLWTARDQERYARSVAGELNALRDRVARLEQDE